VEHIQFVVRKGNYNEIEAKQQHTAAVKFYIDKVIKNGFEALLFKSCRTVTTFLEARLSLDGSSSVFHIVNEEVVCRICSQLHEMYIIDGGLHQDSRFRHMSSQYHLQRVRLFVHLLKNASALDANNLSSDDRGIEQSKSGSSLSSPSSSPSTYMTSSSGDHRGNSRSDGRNGGDHKNYRDRPQSHHYHQRRDQSSSGGSYHHSHV
jgi:hypothetical protein